MKLQLIPNGHQDLWGELNDVFGLGPRHRNVGRTKRELKKVSYEMGQVLGMPEEDFSPLGPIFSQIKRDQKVEEVRGKLSDARRNELGRLEEKQGELLSRLPKHHVVKTWTLKGKPGRAVMRLVHSKHGEVVARMVPRGAVSAALKASDEDRPMLFGEFCYFLQRHLEGRWRAIEVQDI